MKSCYRTDRCLLKKQQKKDWHPIEIQSAKSLIKARNNFEKNSINLLLPLPAKALNVTVRTKETKIPKIPRRFSTLCVFTGANIFSPLIQLYNWNVILKKVPDYWIWLIWIIYQQEIIKEVLRSRSQFTKKVM